MGGLYDTIFDLLNYGPLITVILEYVSWYFVNYDNIVNLFYN